MNFLVVHMFPVYVVKYLFYLCTYLSPHKCNNYELETEDGKL
jgi:hypothetical protein